MQGHRLRKILRNEARGLTRHVRWRHGWKSVNARLRKIIKTRGHFPSDDAASKLIWLALHNITADWSRASHDWKTAMNQFAILYQDRFTRPQA